MQFTTVVVAALAAVVPFVQAGPQAHLNNMCDFDVYLWSVSADGSSDMHTLKANGGTYSEDYQVPSQGGVSLKLSNKTQLGAAAGITQFEYTLTDWIWYDISNVDCQTTDCPFQPYGLYMESGKGCPTATCHAGDLTCKEAYTLYNDDWATKACTTDQDITLHLCSESAPEKREVFGVPSKRWTHGKPHGHPHWRH